MSRVMALVQARMGSNRLPGKVLMDIAGQPMVAHVMRRVQACPGVDGVVLCTSTEPEDRPLRVLAEARGWIFSCGPRDDVMSRLVLAASTMQADTVIRVTGDCPMWDPGIGAAVLCAHWNRSKADLCVAPLTTNAPAEETGYPDGTDTEVYPAMELHVIAERAWDRMRGWIHGWREHPTRVWYVTKQARYVRLPVLHGQVHKWSVDTAEDLAFVREMYAALGTGLWGYPAVLEYLKTRKPS